MFLAALATDYDGTLAHDGRIDLETIEALTRLRTSGRKVILVTGRLLSDIQRVFPECNDVCDAIVAENGAVLFLPGRPEERLLAPAPPRAFIAGLRERQVSPLSIGHSIVATWEPEEHKVLEVISELGLEWQIIFNKGAVMCLPPGINKASGLLSAAAAMDLSPLNIAGIGDAENDHAFMAACGYAAAVANALSTIKAEADFVCERDHGAGVIEFIDRILDDEPALVDPLKRSQLPLGATASGRVIALQTRETLLIAGSSGVGKSRLAISLIERLIAAGRQLCVIDPEGDYDSLAPAARIGNPDRAPNADEAVALMQQPLVNVVVNLLGILLNDRPPFFAQLVSRLAAMRATLGRPHWIVADEVHHLAPKGIAELPAEWRATIALTVDPAAVSTEVLAAITTLIAVGPEADRVIETFCEALNITLPEMPDAAPGDQEVWYWKRTEAAVRMLVVEPPKQEHQRHVRKYAQGELGPDKSFYFRGPDGRLNLRAQNLAIFMQMADGVDDDTWLFHLHRHDYSHWLANTIGDKDAGAAIAEIEDDPRLDAASSRAEVHEALRTRYAGT